MSAQWTSPVLADAYNKIGELRRELARPVDSTLDGILRDLLDQIELADAHLEFPSASAERQEQLHRAARELRTSFREEDFA